MRILKIFDGDYPWDVRVEKIVDSLIEHDHQVRVLCRNQQSRPRCETTPSGLEIHRLPPVAGPLSLPLFFNPLWAHQLERQIREYRPDRLLVRDLPLAPLAVWLGRRHGLPVIADLSEPYPDSLRSQRQFEALSRGARLLRNPRAAEWLERYVLRGADRILVVCPEAGQRLERQGLSPGRWVEVGNTPRLEHFSASGRAAPEMADLDGKFVLLFSGLLAGDRGLELAIAALGRLEASSPGRYALVIVGEGPRRASLESLALQLGLSKSVRFTGFVQHDRLPDLIGRAQVGLLPFHSCPHINSTLANKLFEYMSLSLPVIASDVPPMVRILEETGCGLSFRSGDAQDLARAVEAMASQAERAERFGAAGLGAVRTRYHWQLDADRMVDALETP